MFFMLFILTSVFGNGGFGVGSDLSTIFYNMVFSSFIALAMSYNLTSGRLDFSIGSILILSLIAGASLAKQWQAGPLELVLIVLFIGIVCGLFSGFLYITLRLPAMVTSLGVTMIFESIAFMINRGNGVRLLGRFDLLIWARPPYSLILLGTIVVILVYILNFTKFGYDSASLRTGQKNAVDVGVNENTNALFAYGIGGGLMGAAGLVYLSQYGYAAPLTGLSSSSFMMVGFLPVFIGGALAKYSDRNIGVVIGAFIQASLSSAIVNLGASSSLKTVIDGVIVLLFIIYLSNRHKIELGQMYRIKKERAMATDSGAVS
jgi:ribose transport system permease protein